MKNKEYRFLSLMMPLLLIVFLTLSCGLIGQLEQPDDLLVETPDLLRDELEFEILANESRDGSNVTAGVVSNRSDHLYSVQILMEYLNASGKLLGTQPGAVFDIYPGTEQAFFSTTADDWSQAASVDVKVTNIDKDETTDITPDFEFGKLSIFQHEHGTRILGEVTNNDERQYSINVLGIAFDADQRASMGNIANIDHLQPGEIRMFTVELLGDQTQAVTAQVYLESITQVEDTPENPNLAVENIGALYDPERGRTSIHYDLVNQDPRAYETVQLLIGAYQQSRLVQIDSDVVFSIGPGETIPVDKSLMEGNLEGYEIKIQVNSYRVVP